MFLNAQHPSEDNPAPYDTHAVGAVYNFDGASTGLENLPLQTGSDAETLAVAGDYEHQVLAHGGDPIDGATRIRRPAGRQRRRHGRAEHGVRLGRRQRGDDGTRGRHERLRPDERGRDRGLPLHELRGPARHGRPDAHQPRGRHPRVDRPREGEPRLPTAEGHVEQLQRLDQPVGDAALQRGVSGRGRRRGTTRTRTPPARTAMTRYLGEFGNPYRYGYIVEVPEPTTEETPTPVKRYALGRLSHEVGLAMPDGRTVYLSDDWDGGVFFKFVADRKRDLSSGTLYAAKLHQDATDDPAKAGFDVEWIELAHGEESEIESWIAEYDGQAESADADYITDDEVRDWANGEADDDRVAFLEPRKAAAAKGATNEWQKLEGLATKPNPKPGDALYVACSNIHGTMADYDGDIQLEENAQGAVYEATHHGQLRREAPRARARRLSAQQPPRR